MPFKNELNYNAVDVVDCLLLMMMSMLMMTTMMLKIISSMFIYLVDFLKKKEKAKEKRE